MFKKILIIFIVLGGLGFFEPVFFNRQIIGAIHLMLALIIISLIILYAVYDTSQKIKPLFSFEIFLLLTAVFLSMFGAYFFHDQPFKTTLLAQRAIYLFSFYFLLHQLKPEPRFILRLFIVFSVLWSGLYLLQWFAYPTPLFGSQMFKDRNTIRIFLPGVTFAVIAYFICLQMFLKTNHYKYLMLIFLLLLIFVILGTRQLLGPVLLISIYALVKSKRIHSKIVISLLGIASIIPLYFIFQDIINAMIDITRVQTGAISENIRFKAVLFYFNRFTTNKLSFLIGNGSYGGHSSYSLMMDNYGKIFGYYLADIGIIGEFILYGIIFIIAELIILIRMSFSRYPEEFEFIRYIAYTMYFALFVSAGAFGNSEGIIMMCLLLYLVDLSKWMKINQQKTSPAMNFPEISEGSKNRPQNL
jgi:hypothetical protein